MIDLVSPIDVLVIDDDQDDALLMKRYLSRMQRFNAAVTVESDLDRALALCGEQAYDAVFIDYYWGGRNADELLTDLPPELKTTPFIVITSTDELAVNERVVRAGGWDFICKDDLSPKMLERCLLHAVQRQHHEQQMHRLVRQDSLTGIANRLMFEEQLKRALARAERRQRRVAILTMDLDDFKQINDSLGHDTGDLLLQLVAERLRRELRDEDTLARLGGDEFAILVEDMEDTAQLEVIAHKLMAALRAPTPIRGITSRISGSFGIAIYPTHAQSPLEMMRYADIALYAAKERGRNDVVLFDGALEQGLVESLALEQDMRRAVQSHEFVPWFQPRFRCDDDSLCGVEVLARWNHPTRGVLTPDHFIPVAERSGLMLDIDQALIRQTFSQLAARDLLPGRAQPYVLGFNITVAHLLNQHLTEEMLALCEQFGVAPRHVEFEVVERTLVERSSQRTLHALRAAGFRLAIDDFGTGFSSLSYLRSLPVTTLKIDGSFITELPDDSFAESICEAIILMGHRLSLTLVAEGVETEAENAAIRRLGADAIQGFLMARPMPIDHWQHFYREQTVTGGSHVS